MKKNVLALFLAICLLISALPIQVFAESDIPISEPVEAWVEEDWDEEQECPGPNYQFYDRVIVKDFEGRTLSEEVGSLYEGEDGTWWIS